MRPLASDATLHSNRPVVERREQVYRIVCQILAGQSKHVNWSVFSPSAWGFLVNVAQEEGVAPLLCYTLDAAGWPEGMPPLCRHDLRAAYYHTAAHNLLIYQELTRILTAIHNPALSPVEGSQFTIRTVVLKGAALARTIYPDMALRPLSDIDLLVPRQYLEPAVQALRSLGYAEPHPEMVRGLNRATSWHVHLRGGPHQRIAVELHWNLIASDSDWRTPPLGWFWEQTERWKVEKGKWKKENGGGSPSNLHSPSSVFHLTPTAHLLYLAAHLMLQHGGAEARLLWFYDLHLLIAREGERLDWDELVGRAGEFRWAPALHAALSGLQARFDTQIPHRVLDSLAQIHDPQAQRLVQRKAVQTQAETTGIRVVLARLDWRARLRLAWSIACPSPDYMRWRYKPEPAWLWPLYYPYRWFVILRDGLFTLWRIGRGKMEERKWKGENGRREKRKKGEKWKRKKGAGEFRE